ncbi:MAG: hypothetical protein E7812_08555 [Phenylobacterium sp.]|nr:MAG: hypothetical protein E7812_08555 [Phenylobacterium sp.]
MLVFALALAFAFAQPAAAEGQAAPPPPADAAAAPEAGFPAGAPHDDYQFVAWCYGALRGYLELHDQVMPEVTRIEGEFRRPGSRLEDDLKVYADQQVQARADLRRFQAALTAAEKASLRPINTAGAAAVVKGRNMWNGGSDITKARLAQEWMSWTLPVRCQTTARELEKRAVLMGPAFKANIDPDAPADAAPAPPADKPPEAPPAADKPADAPAAPNN